jgi:hypothetical protein
MIGFLKGTVNQFTRIGVRLSHIDWERAGCSMVCFVGGRCQDRDQVSRSGDNIINTCLCVDVIERVYRLRASWQAGRFGNGDDHDTWTESWGCAAGSMNTGRPKMQKVAGNQGVGETQTAGRTRAVGQEPHASNVRLLT